MKSTLLILFVSVSSAFVLHDSGKESRQRSELINPIFPSDIHYLTSDEPWTDERLFYRLLNLHKNNTIEPELNTERYGPGTMSLKSSDIKRLKNNKQTENNYKLSDSSARKWYFKKGKGIPRLCFFKLCSFKTIQW